MKTRILSLTFALLMLFSVVSLAACKKKTPALPGPTPTPEPTGDDKLTPLDVIDCNNDVFKILWPEVHSDGHFTHNEIDFTGESATGDVIDDAVFKRTARVEDLYNIDIQTELVWCSTIGKNIRNDHLLGNYNYDAVATGIKFLTTAAIEGALADFNEMKYYSEDYEWWDHATMEDFAIGGAKYFGSGDIIYSDNFYPYCFFVNLNYAADYSEIFKGDYNADYFYDLVLDKEWTYDTMLEMSKNVSSAQNDNWDNNAKYGVLVNANTARALYYAFGNNVVIKDEEGFPVWNMKVENTQNVLETIINLFHGSNHPAFNTDVGADGSDHKFPGMSHAQTALAMFTNNQSLFYAEELITSERLHNNDTHVNFAILPMPLANSEQDSYICVMNDAVLLAADASHSNLDRVSLILSALGRASINTLTPAFFENVLTYRYVNDVENDKAFRTLQVILDSVKAQDIATLLDWGGMMTGFKNLVETNKTDFSSLYGENIGKAQDELDSFITKLRFYQQK